MQPLHLIPQEHDTREHILVLAAKLFSERGFANVSIRDLCDAAGVTPPTIYHYFGNKDHLFQAVIRRSLNLTDFRECLFEAVRAQPDPERKLGAFIQVYLAAFPRGFFNPGMFLQSSTQLSGVSTEQVMAEFMSINAMAKEIFQSGQQVGAFKEINLEAVTEFLMNLLMSYVLGEVHYGQAHEADETAAFITDLLVNGLRLQTEAHPTL